jgi:hypothetical protein
VAAGRAKVEGSSAKVTELFGLLDGFDACSTSSRPERSALGGCQRALPLD